MDVQQSVARHSKHALPLNNVRIGFETANRHCIYSGSPANNQVGLSTVNIVFRVQHSTLCSGVKLAFWMRGLWSQVFHDGWMQTLWIVSFPKEVETLDHPSIAFCNHFWMPGRSSAGVLEDARRLKCRVSLGFLDSRSSEGHILRRGTTARSLNSNALRGCMNAESMIWRVM